MSPTIRGMPRSAGSSSCRIDCVPSWRAACAAAAWLLLVCAITLGCVALPFPVRLGLASLVAGFGVSTAWSYALLRGPSAIHAIEWQGGALPGAFSLQVGPGRERLAATLDRRSFRFGRSWLSLAFSTPAGTHRVLLDGGLHDPRAFRRLCREVSRRSRGDSGPRSRSS